MFVDDASDVQIIRVPAGRAVFIRYEVLGPGIDGAPSKNSSELVTFISPTLCVYVYVWGIWV